MKHHVSVEIEPYEYNGKEYCWIKLKNGYHLCTECMTYDMCRYDSYSCDLHGEDLGSDQDGRKECERPQFCKDKELK